MSRRISVKKDFSSQIFKNDNLLISLFVNRILKNGKKCLAKKILDNALLIVESKQKLNPILVLEKAVRNCSPYIQLKSKRIGGATQQVPTFLTRIQSISVGIRWLIQAGRKRTGKSMSIKLAHEIVEASKGIGSVVKRKEETHKMAEANKTFLQFI